MQSQAHTTHNESENAEERPEIHISICLLDNYVAY